MCLDHLFDKTGIFFDREPQSVARRRAQAQARRVARRDRAGPEPHPPSGLAQACAAAGRGRIGLAVGAVLDKHKMGKHFEIAMTDASLVYRRTDNTIAAEACLDGIYVGSTEITS